MMEFLQQTSDPREFASIMYHTDFRTTPCDIDGLFELVVTHLLFRCECSPRYKPVYSSQISDGYLSETMFDKRERNGEKREQHTERRTKIRGT